MRPELLGASKEQLIQWAVQHGAVDEKALRKAYDDIELFCAQNPIGISEFMERLVDLSNCGVVLRDAVERVKRIWGE